MSNVKPMILDERAKRFIELGKDGRWLPGTLELEMLSVVAAQMSEIDRLRAIEEEFADAESEACHVDDEIHRLRQQRDMLRDALEEVVACCEEHDRAVSTIIKRPVHWRDSYLDKARTALATCKESNDA